MGMCVVSVRGCWMSVGAAAAVRLSAVRRRCRVISVFMVSRVWEKMLEIFW